MRTSRSNSKKSKRIGKPAQSFMGRKWLLAGAVALVGLLIPVLALSFTPSQQGVPHTSICENCHDGSVDGSPDIISLFALTSAHPLEPDVTTGCNECHNAAGDLDGFSQYYPKLLRALDPFATYQYAGDAFCGACHGLGSTVLNGDHLSQFTGTPHDVDTDALESGIKCSNCHGPHGEALTPLLLGTVNGNTVSGNDNTQCFACHEVAKDTFPGETAYNATPHGSNSIPENIWPVAGDAGLTTGGPTSGVCINCHNPHGTEDGGSPTAKYTHRNEEGLCFGGNPAAGNCHAAASGSESGIDIYERFTAGDGVASPAELSRHSISDADQTITGSKVECVNCHNTHLNDQTDKTSDPDDVASNFTDTMDDPRFFPMAVIQPDPDDGKDALLASGLPTFNFGSLSSMQIGYLNAAFLYEDSRGIYEIDVSAIPAGSTITSATFYLFQGAGVDAPSETDLTIDLHRVTSSWAESSVDWDSQPSFDGTPEDSVTMDTLDAWRSWDVTALVDDWVNGAVTNNGVVLIAPDAEAQLADWYRVFDTSDRLLNPSLTFKEASRPKLVIEYSSASPPQVSDSIGFCGRCHDGTPPAGVTVPASVKQVLPSYTDSSAQGDYHGGRAGVLNEAETSEGEIIGPYYPGMPPMDCADCHDPHGSENVYSLREEVNGKTGISVPTVTNKTAIKNFCGACHMFTHTPVQSCFECHFHGANTDVDVNTVF